MKLFLTYIQASFSTTFTNTSFLFPIPIPNVPYGQITYSFWDMNIAVYETLSSFLVCPSLNMPLALHNFLNHRAGSYILLNVPIISTVYQLLPYKDLWVPVQSTSSLQKKSRNSLFLQRSIFPCEINQIIASKDPSMRFNQRELQAICKIICKTILMNLTFLICKIIVVE